LHGSKKTPVRIRLQNGTPLKLVGKYEFPSSVTGRFDHLLVDLKTQRMFTTPQSAKAVMVSI